MKYISLIVIALSLFVAACEDPAANKPAATVSESVNSQPTAQPVSTVPRPETRGDALAVTPDNSKIEFVGSKVTGKHDGGFRQFTGTIDLVNGKAEDSSVFVEIDMASVFTDAEGLTEHLKKADFFDVEKFPKSSFRSTKIVADTAKGTESFNVTGDLNLHGVTKSISFPATIKISENEVTVNAEFSINRKDFGINYAGMANDLIRDLVVIKLDLKTPRMN